MAEKNGASPRITVTLDDATQHKLEQILDKRPRQTHMTDLVREALEMYLDNQADIIGSRQHFNRTLKRRLEELEAHMADYLTLLIFLNANGLSQVTNAQGEVTANFLHFPTIRHFG